MIKKFLNIFVLLTLVLLFTSTSGYAQERDSHVDVSFEQVMADYQPFPSTVEIRYGECPSPQIAIEFDESFNFHLTENNPGDSDIFSISDADVVDPTLGVYSTVFEIEFTPLPAFIETSPGDVFGALGTIGISCSGGEIIWLGNYVVGLRLVPWQNFLPLIVQ